MQVPRDFDLRTLLQEIGNARDPDDFLFAVGHLQHALQIYIVGHFLCELRVRSPGNPVDGWSVTEVLSSKSGLQPGLASQKELQQAFSLSALSHDVGMLLFPRMFYQYSGLSQNDRELKQSLNHVEEVIRQSASELIEQSERELRESEYFDRSLEPSLWKYLQRAKTKGVADHSLLGAWYLHRFSQGVDGLSTRVVRQAVRAVLMHTVVDQVIDAEQDPVAAMLVLCDQIFEWLPSYRARNSGGRLGLDQIAGPNKTLLGSRAATIELGEMTVSRGAMGGIKCEIVLDESESARGWPHFKVALQHPDLLDVPVYRVWLSMAHNLCRVHMSESGWSGRVSLTSEVPGELLTQSTDTRGFLEQVVQEGKLPFRNRLAQWLAVEERFEREDGKETVHLWPLERPVGTGEIGELFRSLSDEYTRALLPTPVRLNGVRDSYSDLP